MLRLNEFTETRRLHDYLEGSVVIGRCRALLSQGQTDAAWELCRPLTDTDDVDKIVAIGMLFGESQKFQQALAAWEKAIALDPDSSEIQYNFALTCFHLKDMLRARRHAAEAVHLRPDFVEANIAWIQVIVSCRLPLFCCDPNPEDQALFWAVFPCRPISCWSFCS